MGPGIAKLQPRSGGAPIQLSQQVLRTDASGIPLEWIDYREAVRLYCLGQVSYAFGSTLYTLRGGVNARSGRRTQLEINSMLATHGQSGNPGSLRHDYVPPLNNETLFKRDGVLAHQVGPGAETGARHPSHLRYAAGLCQAVRRSRGGGLPGQAGEADRVACR